MYNIIHHIHYKIHIKMKDINMRQYSIESSNMFSTPQRIQLRTQCDVCGLFTHIGQQDNPELLM